MYVLALDPSRFEAALIEHVMFQFELKATLRPPRGVDYVCFLSYETYIPLLSHYFDL